MESSTSGAASASASASTPGSGAASASASASASGAASRDASGPATGRSVAGLPLRDLRDGARDTVPILVGIVPFGLVAGYSAVEAGLSPAQAVGMSVIVFAGASQIALIELLGNDAPLTVAVATALVINARLLMYSASIAPYFRAFRTRTKAGLAYVLTDQAFALSVSAYRSDRGVDRRAYYLGAAGALWLVWQVATAAGVLLGGGVPASWGLTFAVPLVFLALLVPALVDRPSAAAAVVGGGVALLARDAPSDAGLLVGGLAGVLAGLAVERATDADPPAVDADRGHGGDAGERADDVAGSGLGDGRGTSADPDGNRDADAGSTATAGGGDGGDGDSGSGAGEADR